MWRLVRIGSHESLNNKLSIKCNHEQPILKSVHWQSHQRHDIEGVSPCIHMPIIPFQINRYYTLVWSGRPQHRCGSIISLLLFECIRTLLKSSNARFLDCPHICTHANAGETLERRWWHLTVCNHRRPWSTAVMASVWSLLKSINARFLIMSHPMCSNATNVVRMPSMTFDSIRARAKASMRTLH